MKTSTIKEIINIREWTGSHGIVFYYQLELGNGDIGTIGKKRNDAFKVGDSLTYTIEQTDRGNNFKEVKENSFGGTQSSGNLASFALSYSKDLTTAFVTAGKSNGSTSEQLTAVTIKNADTLLKWLKDNQ